MNVMRVPVFLLYRGEYVNAMIFIIDIVNNRADGVAPFRFLQISPLAFHFVLKILSKVTVMIHFDEGQV